MRLPKTWGKDHLGAGLLLVLGTAMLSMGATYRMGTLNHMGAGFIPVVLGALMVFVGVALGVTAAPAGKETIAHPLPGDGKHKGIDVRGWLCILGGVIAFVLLGEHGGLLPATFAAVFISAMGDRNNTVKSSATLGAILSLFCLLIFHYGLKLQLPLFQWA